ncbi:hypothetical protein AX16_001257 [Volvariella volvacea WC 439]|nr:hypothetical protein AX16_001257 [Volvariella volvacea WC 439]
MEGFDAEHLQDEDDMGIPTLTPSKDGSATTKSQRNKRPSPPPRRPLTRSQTGHVAKRKLADEPVIEARPRPTATRKKARSTPKSPAEDSAATTPQDSSTPQPSIPSAPSSVRDTSESSVSLDMTPLNSTPLTFLDNPSPTSAPSIDRRGPRSRAVLPVPVPNLTKKSRGRRVPTKPVQGQEGALEQTRLYVCQVEGCGKCFHRGEHLKRHIRSIHTYEKPFKCTHPGCEKYFNRHDNLLQHLKVHKTPVVPQLKVNDGSEVLQLLQPAQVRQPETENLAIPMHKPEKPMYQPPAFVSYSITTPYGSGLGPGYATNVAVSSLRTELPQSPPTTRTLEPLRGGITSHLHPSQEGNPPLLPLPTAQPMAAHNWKA